MYLAVILLFQLALAYAIEEVTLSPGATVLTSDDFARAANTNYTGPKNDSAMYHSDKFEGDIALKAEQVSADGRSRNGLRDRKQLWPRGEVPYELDSSFTIKDRTEIAAAMKGIMDKTCIRFVARRSTDKNYIHIYNYGGCWSYVGVTGGSQEVHLGGGCNNRGTITHELSHALGFFHEQARNDRDEYIEVLLQNINPDDRSQFDKQPLTKIDHLGTAYDYDSVMHYSEYAFSANGQPTIRVLRGNHNIGFKPKMSPNDVVKVNALYSCNGKPKPNGCEDVGRTCSVVVRLGDCGRSPFHKTCAKSCGKC